MIFGEVPLADALGGVLAHAVLIGGQRRAKGTIVDAALIASARADGIAALWIARAEPGDIGEQEAARAIGTALAGTGVEARAPVHGRVNLHAGCDGLLLVDAAAIGAANSRTEDIGIATLPPFSPVSAGDLVATVKIIPFALAGQRLETVLLTRGAIEVRSWRTPVEACLVQTVHPAGSGKAMAKTEAVTRERLLRFGWTLRAADPVPHAIAPLAAALDQWRARADLILVAGAAATADRRDVIPAAIEAAGGRIGRVGMPVDPGNLLVLGGFDPGAKVIGLPGCAKSPKRNGLDLVLERFAAGLALDSSSIGGMGVGGLLEESGVPVPWAWGG
jgi:molybdenum cofactor cytidylyltransferase